MENRFEHEQAFASSLDEHTGHDHAGNKTYTRYNEIGMSKRFYAACAAMQGILANPTLSHNSDRWVCEQAYAIADKMIEFE